MFYNNNKQIVTKLAKRSFKSNKTRNLFVIIGIILTTVLITTTFTIGMSIIDSMEMATIRQVGTSAHGGLKYLTEEEYNLVKDHPLAKEHGMTMVLGIADNKEFRSKSLEIRYVDENYAKWGFCTPTKGHFPVNENELATSTWALDMLGVEPELGAKVTLQYTIMNEQYTKDFVISGLGEGDKNIEPAGTAIVSKDFVKEKLEGKDNFINGKVKGNIDVSFMFNSKYHIKENLDKIVKDTGLKITEERYGINWAYIGTGMTDFSDIIPFIIILLLIMFSGYLLIYNIFYISVAKDIKYYGLLKTIGTTSKQLKKIIFKQAMILSIIGIPIGLILGYGIGYLMIPMVMSTTTIESAAVSSTNPLIFLGAAIFSLITVFISCRKPAKYASRVSPIEAVRYTGVDSKNSKKIKTSKNGAKIYKMSLSNMFRNKKKAFIVIISLSLSIILFNCTYTLISGFNIDKYLSSYIRGAFVISDYSYFGSRHFNSENTVTDNMCEKIKNTAGVERIDKIYYSYAQDSVDDHKIEVMEKAKLKDYTVEDNMKISLNDGAVDVQMYGLDEGCMDMYTGDVIQKGKIDLEKFKTGKYILINHDYSCDYYDVGDKVTITLKDGSKQSFEVMALVDYVRNFDVMWFTPTGYKAYIPSSAFTELIDNPVILNAQVFTQDSSIKEVENVIKDISAGEPNLEYRSKANYVDEYKEFISLFSTVGYSLSMIIAMIGLLNYINTILTSIISRKMEFAMLQSIGMTKKQLIKMLTFEGLYYGIITIMIISTFGVMITQFAVNSFGGQMDFFQYHFNISPIIICSFIVVLISGIIPRICYGSISKLSIIERLREIA